MSRCVRARADAVATLAFSALWLAPSCAPDADEPREAAIARGDVREIRDLLDEHPHTVTLRCRNPRALAEAVVKAPHVLSLTFGAEGEWLTVQTARPDEFYGSLPEAAVAAGVSEMYSPDEDLESVFKYLVAR